MVEEKHWFKPTIILLVACLWFMHGILLPVTYVYVSCYLLRYIGSQATSCQVSNISTLTFFVTNIPFYH